MIDVATRIEDAGPKAASQLSPARSIGSNGRSSGFLMASPPGSSALAGGKEGHRGI
jgi:hypothetical protein